MPEAALDFSLKTQQRHRNRRSARQPDGGRLVQTDVTQLLQNQSSIERGLQGKVGLGHRFRKPLGRTEMKQDHKSPQK